MERIVIKHPIHKNQTNFIHPISPGRDFFGVAHRLDQQKLEIKAHSESTNQPTDRNENVRTDASNWHSFTIEITTNVKFC